jgi:outer membrane protein OmpA-like peptidoglycan-associated protein
MVCIAMAAGCASKSPETPAPERAADGQRFQIEQSAQVRDLITGQMKFVFCSAGDCQEVSPKVFAQAKRIQVQQVAVAGSGAKLFSVAFAYDKSDLSREAVEVLDKVVREAANAKQIKLVGKADTVNRDTYNRALAARRAEAAKQYLLQKGVSAPIATSAEIVRVTPSGMYPPGETFKGRRVDMELLVEVVKS